MTSLFRHSRLVVTRAPCIWRSSATTSTPGGGTSVRSSGASKNLSQASRSADGTDMAMRDAEQRSTTPDSTKPKSTGQSSQAPPTGSTSSAPWGMIGFGIVLAIGSYFVYTNYIKNPDLTSNKEASNRDAHAHQSTDRDASGGKKH